MPFGQPLYIFLCAGLGFVIVIFTAPIWTRLAKSAYKLLKRQVNEGAEVLEAQDQPQDDNKES